MSNKSLIEKGLAITKRIGRSQIEQLERDWGLQKRDSMLNEMSQKSAPVITKNIMAAIELLYEAGEGASNLQDAIVKRLFVTKERQQLLYDRASTLTLLHNIEQFLSTPDEARRFIDSLPEEARNNLFDALLEIGGKNV